MDTSVVIANALVSSRLDYCNSLFRILSSRNATRLQYVQNALARFVTGASKYTHITSTLRTLHWLPIRQHIIFKTLVLVYKYLTQCAKFAVALWPRAPPFKLWLPELDFHGPQWATTLTTTCLV